MREFRYLMKVTFFVTSLLFITISVMGQTWTAYNGCPPSFTDLNATYLKKFYSTSSTFSTHSSYLNYSAGTSGASHTIITSGGNDLNAYIPSTNPTIYLQKLPTWDGVPQTQVFRLNEPTAPGTSGYYGASSVYKFIPDSLNNILNVYFAFVVQLPHETYDANPVFQIRVLNTSNQLIYPQAYYLLNTGYVNGVYYPNPAAQNISWYLCGSGYETAIWVDWTPIAFDLRNFVGQEVKLELIATGCMYSGHWGYAYYTAKCLEGRLTATSCEGEDLIVTAPNGFEDYTWYDRDGNEIGWAERYYTPRDTNMTYARCVMHSRTGAEIEMDINITYYDLTSQFDYTQIKDACNYKIQFENTGIVRIIGGSSVTLPVQYTEWDFGDGSPLSTEVNPLHTYDNPGTYNVRCILFDPDNVCADTITRVVVVDPDATIQAHTTDTARTCQENLPYVYNADYSFAQAGTYQAVFPEASWNGCDSLVDVTLIVENPQVVIQQQGDYCDQFSSNLIAETEAQEPSFLWNDGSTLGSLVITAPGTYSVTVTDISGCVAQDAIVIPACVPNIVLPNSISPSDDNGLNDYFYLPQKNLVDKVEVSIFDRYGTMVFHTFDKDFKWAGEVYGKKAINSTFNYIIYITDYNGIVTKHTGSITVL